MYKFYKINTNRLMLKKVLPFFNKYIIEEENVISPRPLTGQNVTSNILYIKVKENSKNYNKSITFKNYKELSEEEYLVITNKIEFKW